MTYPKAYHSIRAQSIGLRQDLNEDRKPSVEEQDDLEISVSEEDDL